MNRTLCTPSLIWPVQGTALGDGGAGGAYTPP